MCEMLDRPIISQFSRILQLKGAFLETSSSKHMLAEHNTVLQFLTMEEKGTVQGQQIEREVEED